MLNPYTDEELQAAREALDRIEARKQQTDEEWATSLAPELVAGGCEYDARVQHFPNGFPMRRRLWLPNN